VIDSKIIYLNTPTCFGLSIIFSVNFKYYEKVLKTITYPADKTD